MRRYSHYNCRWPCLGWWRLAAGRRCSSGNDWRSGGEDVADIVAGSSAGDGLDSPVIDSAGFQRAGQGEEGILGRRIRNRSSEARIIGNLDMIAIRALYC